MLLLLPPSEGKSPAPKRGRPADPARWSFPELTPLRRQVATSLAELGDGPAAFAALGVSERLHAEVAMNLRLFTAPARPASQVYTGVLFDAFGYQELDAAARRRAQSWVVIMSALHGALRLTDRITPYRLAAGTDLPGLGIPDRLWREALAEPLAVKAGRGVVVDARSAAYAAFWRPRAPQSQQWVTVAVPGASHMAKHTRGLVARWLCNSERTPTTPHEVAEVIRHHAPVTLTEPTSAGRPWVLSVSPS